MKKILTFTLCVLLVCLIPVSVCAADGTEAAAETAPTETAAELISVKFEEWVLPHLEEISVVITLIFSLFYQMRKHTLLSRSIGTMNNNAVSIAEEVPRADGHGKRFSGGDGVRRKDRRAAGRLPFDGGG